MVRADKSPLVRALAIRTMGCIRVDRITEYLADPLARALKDKDPYVRKTAVWGPWHASPLPCCSTGVVLDLTWGRCICGQQAVCVAKLWDINKDLVEEQGFLDSLRAMIGDPNPMVVSNAVAGSFFFSFFFFCFLLLSQRVESFWRWSYFVSPLRQVTFTIYFA